MHAPLAIVDLETTGTDPATDRITEIAVLEVDGFALTAQWSTLVNPGGVDARADPGAHRHHPGDGGRRAALRRSRRRAARAARRARVRRAQRALRLRLPAARVRARRHAVPGEDAVHRAAVAPALSRRGRPQPRQPDRAPRPRLRGAPSRRSATPTAVWQFLRIAADEHGEEVVDGRRAPDRAPADAAAAPRARRDRRGARRRPASTSSTTRAARRSTSARAARCARACCSTSSPPRRWTPRVRRIEWQRTAGELGALLREARAGEGARPGLQPPAAPARAAVRLRLRRHAAAPRAAPTRSTPTRCPSSTACSARARAALEALRAARRRAPPVPADAGLRVRNAALLPPPDRPLRRRLRRARKASTLHHARVATALAAPEERRLAAPRPARRGRARPRRATRPKCTWSTAGATSAPRAATAEVAELLESAARRASTTTITASSRATSASAACAWCRSPPDALRARRPGPVLGTRRRRASPALELLLARGRREHGPRRSRSSAGCTKRSSWTSSRSPPARSPCSPPAATPASDAGCAPTRCTCALMRDRVVVVPAEALHISASEADALCAALNRPFRRRDGGRALDAGAGARVSAELGSTTAGARLPAASRAAAGDALLTEIQMLLHAHPVNEAREARGEPAVNSLWLWGAGRRQRSATLRWQSVAADDPAGARRCARSPARATARCRRRAVAGSQRLPEDGRHLALLDAAAPRAALADAGARLVRAAARRAARRAHRHGDAARARRRRGGSFETIRGDLRRFWRPAKPIEHYA